MKQFIIYLFVICIFTSIGWFANTYYHLPRSKTKDNPIVNIIKPTPLAKYTIPNLATAKVDPVEIKIGDIIKENDKFTSYKFFMEFDPTLSGSKDLKKVSGLLNIPNSSTVNSQLSPVIVMFRGYVDPKMYFTGLGTQHAAEFFAEHGFITIAPDFLGYGESSKEAEDIFEARFQTYTTAITLLKSIPNSSFYIPNSPIFIWGHSNGGQIALTTLEATGLDYPTVLWAPVSKPFPYSILYYTDEASDSGKFLRQKTSEFESIYNSDLYSLTKYLNRIKAPIHLNQGTIDDAVPVAWSNLLIKNLKEASVSAEYIKYPGADHNMQPIWNNVVINNLQFYKKHLE